MKLVFYNIELYGAEVSGVVYRKHLPEQRNVLITFDDDPSVAARFIVLEITMDSVTVIEDREATQQEIDEAQ
jgi:hypothetical protein